MKFKYFLIFILPLLFAGACKKAVSKKDKKPKVKVQAMDLGKRKKEPLKLTVAKNLEIGDRVKRIDLENRFEIASDEEGVFLGREGNIYFVKFDNGYIEGLDKKFLKPTGESEEIDKERAETTRLEHFCRLVSVGNMAATYREIYEKNLGNKLKETERDFLKSKRRCLKDLIGRDDFEEAAINNLKDAQRQFINFANREYEVKFANQAKKWIKENSLYKVLA